MKNLDWKTILIFCCLSAAIYMQQWMLNDLPRQVKELRQDTQERFASVEEQVSPLVFDKVKHEIARREGRE